MAKTLISILLSILFPVIASAGGPLIGNAIITGDWTTTGSNATISLDVTSQVFFSVPAALSVGGKGSSGHAIVAHTFGTQGMPILGWSSSGAAGIKALQDTYFNEPAFKVFRSGTATVTTSMIYAGMSPGIDSPFLLFQITGSPSTNILQIGRNGAVSLSGNLLVGSDGTYYGPVSGYTTTTASNAAVASVSSQVFGSGKRSTITTDTVVATNTTTLSSSPLTVTLSTGTWILNSYTWATSTTSAGVKAAYTYSGTVNEIGGHAEIANGDGSAYVTATGSLYGLGFGSNLYSTSTASDVRIKSESLLTVTGTSSITLKLAQGTAQAGQSVSIKKGSLIWATRQPDY